jgi:hypothetical protein
MKTELPGTEARKKKRAAESLPLFSGYEFP